MNAGLLKRVREYTTPVRLLTGEVGYVTMGEGLGLPDHWFVTLAVADEPESHGEVRHDRRTGTTNCSCGELPTCLHRSAVRRVTEGIPIAPVIG